MIVKVKFLPVAIRNADILIDPERFAPEVRDKPWIDENEKCTKDPNIQYRCSYSKYWSGYKFDNDDVLQNWYFDSVSRNLVRLNGPIELSIDIGDETDPVRIFEIIWEKADLTLEDDIQAILENRHIARPASPSNPENDKYFNDLNERLGLLPKKQEKREEISQSNVCSNQDDIDFLKAL